MDIYEAAQAILEEASPVGVNVSAYVLTYDEATDKFDLPAFPAVTYNIAEATPVVTAEGSSNLLRVSIDIEVWGDLEQIDRNAKAVYGYLNAKRIRVNNVEFTLVMRESRDIAELGLDFKRRYMRFMGLADIREENNDDSR